MRSYSSLKGITDAIRAVARSEGADVDKIEADMNEKADRYQDEPYEDKIIEIKKEPEEEKLINIDEGQGKNVVEDEPEIDNLNDSYEAPEEVAQLKAEDRILTVDAKADEVEVYPKEIESKEYAPSEDVMEYLRYVPRATKDKFLRFYATAYYNLKYNDFYDGEPPEKKDIDQAYLRLLVCLRYGSRDDASKLAMALELIISDKVSFADPEAKFRTDSAYIKGLAEHLTNIIDFVEEYRKNYGDQVADIVFNTINSWTQIIDMDKLKVLDKAKYEEMEEAASDMHDATKIGFEITMHSKQSLVDGLNRIRKAIFDQYNEELKDEKDGSLANELKRNIFLALSMKTIDEKVPAMSLNLRKNYNALAQNAKQREFLNLAVSMINKNNKNYILNS